MHLLAGMLVVLALAWPVWRALDAVPLARGRRWRNGGARLLLAAAVTLVVGACNRAIVLVSVGLFGSDPRFLTEPSMQWGPQFLARAASGFVILAVAHAMLQRSHEVGQRDALEHSLAQARLQALSLELQPHFLFNTLNGIAALVRDDPRRAERMLVRLSDLLRVTLQAGVDGAISLRRELEHLDLYLDLQAMRFGPRLTVVRDVDPATLGARVPGMLLRVSDDGVGLPPDVERRERTGIGTTRARLAAMFGEAQGLVLTPAAGRGTVVEVRIPFTPSPG